LNKAFLKEQEDPVGRCPRCGSPGSPVPAETLVAFLSAEQRASISGTAYFCGSPRCEAVYFDDFERWVPLAGLHARVWPKDADAPLCACFGLRADDVAADVREGGVARVKDVVTRSKTSEARCSVLSPSGHNCSAEVQRYYFRLRSQGGP
jgi:hypothetical protein